MPKYRKKPVVIEARQWDGTAEGATPIIDWVLTGSSVARYFEEREELRAGNGEVAQRAEPTRILIQTLEGAVHASPGDYVIKGVQGEFYPCKPDIFQATYEAVDE